MKTPIRLYHWVPVLFAILWLTGLLGCARMPVVGGLFTERDITIVGTIAKVERNESYEIPCRLLCLVSNGFQTPYSRAYDAIVVDSSGRKTQFMFFAPRGNLIPVVGEFGTWRLRGTAVTKFDGCNQYGCPYDDVLQLRPEDWTP